MIFPIYHQLVNLRYDNRLITNFITITHTSQITIITLHFL